MLHVVEAVFYFFGVDVLSAGSQEHVFASSFDEEVAVGVDESEVAGV